MCFLQTATLPEGHQAPRPAPSVLGMLQSMESLCVRHVAPVAGAVVVRVYVPFSPF